MLVEILLLQCHRHLTPKFDEWSQCTLLRISKYIINDINEGEVPVHICG